MNPTTAEAQNFCSNGNFALGLRDSRPMQWLGRKGYRGPHGGKMEREDWMYQNGALYSSLARKSNQDTKTHSRHRPLRDGGQAKAKLRPSKLLFSEVRKSSSRLSTHEQGYYRVVAASRLMNNSERRWRR